MAEFTKWYQCFLQPETFLSLSRLLPVCFGNGILPSESLAAGTFLYPLLFEVENHHSFSTSVMGKKIAHCLWFLCRPYIAVLFGPLFHFRLHYLTQITVAGIKM
ncbi:hypothetical protein AVEN_266350-1 [Araneus ventricosus]|uniref:Uncharacterized protein n=1 Tax=Araneus ventricosus TaxID=182803 RepID=A0A4Y2CSY7_ARAVE|nr:hypothetical protein AVEN_266350-1 [Araneus ventricosus]